MMMVSDRDDRSHQPPLGWQFMGQDPEHMPEYEAVAWFLERVW